MQKAFKIVLTAILFTVFLGQAVFAQYGRPQSRKLTVDLFEAANPGQWIEIDGIPQPDMTLMAEKVKLLTGDFEDDSWEIYGKVLNVNAEDSTFRIMNLKIRVNAETEFETDAPGGKFASFADLKPGLLVEAEGTYLKDGTFLADEVQDETLTADEDEAKEVSLTGRIEYLNPSKRELRVMGIRCIITPQTVVKSSLK